MENRISMAIKRIREFEPKGGYYLAFSGGKDSIVLYDLAIKAGVKFDAHFSVTTVDPPELLNFIKNNYPDVIWDRPRISMFQLILKKRIPPMRRKRYCCEELKERGGEGRTCLIGIRWAESWKRKNRRMVESCQKKAKFMVHPIIDWKTNDIWDYIHINKLKYCELYDKGYKRIGCILCPMQYYKRKWRDAVMFPKFYRAYLLTFQKMLDNMKIEHGKYGNRTWKTGQDVMDWYLEKNRNPEAYKTFFEANPQTVRKE